MITHGTTYDKFTKYQEGDFWIKMQGHVAILYHKCCRGADCNVLLTDEIHKSRCNLCGKIKIPDDLWTLYVLLNGRGVC